MNKLIDRYKYYFTTDIVDLDITIMDLFILTLTAIWGIVLFLILPISLISSLFNN